MTEIKEILVPDIGDFEGVEVIEILVAPGDSIHIEDPLVSLESDKAAMEIPAEVAGTVREVKVKLGEKVSQGDPLITLEVSDASATTEDTPPTTKTEPETAKPEPAALEQAAEQNVIQKPTAAAAVQRRPTPASTIDEARFSKAHGQSAIRKFARELGADLGQINGSGPSGRILKQDVKDWIKQTLTTTGSGNTLGIEPMPEIDFSQFGEIQTLPLTRINQLTGKFLHRNWVNIPHVTQFDEADITELENFRKQLNEENKKEGTRITVLAFLMKALVSALKQYPRFNSSLDHTGENIILKKYVNIGVAMDTPAGLVVPVIVTASANL